MTNYCFVLDADNKQLSPTKEIKAWYMIRKKRAKLVNKYPMVIQISKTIDNNYICKDEIRCGIDDGSLYVGIALVQKCQNKNKVLFKGTIIQRKDVKHRMSIRKYFRKYHRSNKRYRPERFNNRLSSTKKDRIAPTILQKRQAILRVINKLNKWINISNYWLEDIAIDIAAISKGYKPYKWQYQKSDKLDENIRKAVILRDGCKCMKCGKSNTKLEVHHIKPKRLNGSNTMDNLITLCSKCHRQITGKEELFMNKLFNMINSSDNKYLNYANHVMIGKNWLRRQLLKLGKLYIFSGGDTANRRIDWDINKTHSNDAICITNLKPDSVNISEWIIKPIRRQCDGKTDNVLGITYRDLVQYTYKNGETYQGYVTALRPQLKSINFKSPNKHCKGVKANKCKLLWHFSKIYWFKEGDFS